MIRYLREHYHLIFIYLLSFSVLMPKLDALDNSSIRFFSLSVLIFIYLIYNLSRSLLKKNIGLVVSSIISIFLITISFFQSVNINESIISYSKYLTIIAALYSTSIALSKINNPFLSISKVMCLSLIIESLYTLITFFVFDIDSLTGISMNRNISAFSILLKLPMLHFLYINSNLKIRGLLKFIEVASLLSIILLQSRAAILGSFLIYLLLIIIQRDHRKYLIFSILVLSSIFAIYQNNLFSSSYKKSFNLFEHSQDESFNLRLGYYSDAIDLFTSKPVFGHGIGSWKYKSLEYQSLTDSSFHIPYYTHNDFLQILVELGILGFLLYASIHLILLYNCFKLSKKNYFYRYVFLGLIIFLITSLLNFPIHRSQEFLPFIYYASSILISFKINSSSLKLEKTFVIFLVANLLLASFSSLREYKASTIEKLLIEDYKLNRFSIALSKIKNIKYNFPNLTSNTVPISTYLSRYYINENKYNEAEDLIKYSLKSNPNDIISNELSLKVQINKQNYLEALENSRDLFRKNPNNKVYANIYFNLLSSLFQIVEFNTIFINEISQNEDVHKYFYENYLKATYDLNHLRKNLNQTIKIFPDNLYFNELYNQFLK